eukprot:gene4642-8215_t
MYSLPSDLWGEVTFEKVQVTKATQRRSKKSPLRSTRSNSSTSNDENLFKTEICKAWELGEECTFGDKCQYAHGIEELRGKDRHQKYKTSLCKGYHEDGHCPYGSRCSFIHGEPFIPKDGAKKKRLACFRKLTPFDECFPTDNVSSVLPQLKNMEI